MTIDPRLSRTVAAQPYPLLFATISGSHLYGFPSPDSDFDLRGAHVLPLEKVVGLDVRDETVQDSRVIEGLEMDIVSHDVRKFFGLLLKKNGYVLEQLFSPLIVHTTPEHAELKKILWTHFNPRSSRALQTPSARAGQKIHNHKELGSPATVCILEGNEALTSDTHHALVAPKSDEGGPRTTKDLSLVTSAATGIITKHHSHHYFGFAETQWKLFLKESPRRVKPLLYVYRVLLTGIHLMRTGEVEPNLVTLNQEFRLPYLTDLVARKLAGPEKSKLEDADLAFHESEYQRLRVELQAAHDASPLPELSSDETRRVLNDLLVRLRRFER
jgi:predicted nucleotidyltransferase